jgi:hypothetical protein
MSPTIYVIMQNPAVSLLAFVIYRVSGMRYSGDSLRGGVLVEWSVRKPLLLAGLLLVQKTAGASTNLLIYVEYIDESLG